MHDAHNLAWKIGMVARGHAGPGLLDTYEAERAPVGRRTAAETAAAWTRIFAGTGEPFAGRSLAQLDMGYQYASAAVTGDGGPDADPPGADYIPGAAPGCRAPHLWLDSGRSTIDLFDRDPVLLTAPAGGTWREAAAAFGVPLTTVTIGQPAWPALYGVAPDGAVLVRPDGHVAWRARAAGPAGDLAAAARRALS